MYILVLIIIVLEIKYVENQNNNIKIFLNMFKNGQTAKNNYYYSVLI